MAQNFFDKILTLTGLQSSKETHHSAPSIYRTEVDMQKKSSGVSSVEKYQRKKDTSSTLTSTERYLAKKQQQEEQTTQKLTGVDRYLRKKQQQCDKQSKNKATQLAKMTGG
ncbi:MAG: hypothetical protein Q9M50_06690 [Methylococcales bacterium]|nr:hypothetical protein [Methylococcales bacterium]